MLKLHETETCEGIIQYLEKRERAKREDVEVRDRGNSTLPNARVEMTFRLGGQLYALEHTSIEPFDGFIEHQNRASALFHPLTSAATAAIKDILSPGVVIEMHLPIDGFNGRKLREVRVLQLALVEHVRKTASTLPIRRYGDYRGTLFTAQPPGVPFPVSLVRFDGLAGVDGRFQLKHLTWAIEQPRAARIQRACNDKFPKLHTWKLSDNARTILVFEDNDVQLTNTPAVADAFLPIAMPRSDRPDETYMVSTCSEPWYAWPLLVGERTYFDLDEDGRTIHFQMDETGQLLSAWKPS